MSENEEKIQDLTAEIAELQRKRDEVKLKDQSARTWQGAKPMGTDRFDKIVEKWEQARNDGE